MSGKKLKREKQAALPVAPISRKKVWTFRALAALIPIVLLLLAELGLRLASWGDPAHFFIPSDSGPPGTYMENRKFGSRFFPSGLVRVPDPIRLTKKKPEGTRRIFVFGESAALGDPEPAYSFSRILRELLEQRCPGTRFEVVNVAMTAINSHVILPIARDCVPFQGDVWIIYMGNNEVIGPFGAGSALGSKSWPLWAIRTSFAVKRLRVAQLVDGLVERAFSRGGPPREWEGMAMWLNQQVRANDPGLARVEHHFARNLEDIMGLAARSRVSTVLCSVSSNLRDCAPFASLHQPELSSAKKAQWEKLYSAGVDLESRKDYAGALAPYRQAAAIDGTFAELSFRTATCYAALGDAAFARQEYIRARDLDTLRFRTDSRLSAVIRHVWDKHSGANTRFLDSESVLTNACEMGIPGAECLWDHVHFNFKGDYLVARALADQVISLLPTGDRDMARTNANWFSEEECAARLAYTDWDRRLVLQEMIRRVEQPPFTNQLGHERRHQQWSDSLAELRGRTGPDGLARAVGIYRAALAHRPEDWILRQRFGSVLEQVGDFGAAEAEWKKVLGLVPGYYEACFKLGDLCSRASRFDEALDFFHQTLRARPNSYEAMNGVGLVLMEQKNFDEAAQWFQRALSVHPAFTQAQVNLGLLESRRGHTSAAEDHFRRVLATDSNNVAAHINLGNLLVAQQKHADACEQYRAAIQVQPGEATAHYSLANCLDLLGRSDEALAQYREAVRLNPQFFDAVYNLGVAYAMRGDLEAAAQAFENAVRLRPEDIQARLSLGAALLQQNRPREAAAQFEEVIRLDSSNEKARGLLRAAQTRLKGRP